jgi:acyl-CoA synthetase (AMP-forming)/AMP-acid ligase II
MASVITPVLRQADTNPEHVALRSAQSSWTYAQLRDAALAYAEALRKQGIGPGAGSC